jgi:hypothetical protein
MKPSCQWRPAEPAIANPDPLNLSCAHGVPVEQRCHDCAAWLLDVYGLKRENEQVKQNL